MRSLYENEELGISKEDFEAPELVTIPIDCDEVDLENLELLEKKDDLKDLGF